MSILIDPQAIHDLRHEIENADAALAQAARLAESLSLPVAEVIPAERQRLRRLRARIDREFTA